MARTHTIAACLCLATALPAVAASGQIDSFGASATRVPVGTTVDFSIGYSLSMSQYSNGGSDPHEPAPVEGYQYWNVNWYTSETETLDQVRIDAGGQSFVEFPAAVPGGSHAGSWTFSMLFDTPGSYTITAAGGWTNWVDFYTSNESAWRECWNNDPGGTDELACSWWTWEYSDWSDHYTTDGNLGSQSLTIAVLAVPEPHGALLGLAGLTAIIGLRARRA